MNPNQINNGQPQIQNQQAQQTQVLNLEEIQTTAKEEKKASFPKKFAVCLFALGVLAIVGGISYNSVSSLLGTNSNNSGNTEETESENTSTDKAASVEEVNDITSCQMAIPNQTNGTDKEVTYELLFNDENQLQSYTKVLNVTPTTGNSTGPVTVNTLKTGYTTIAAYQIPGYTLAVTPTNDGEVAGLQVTLNIDLKSFDKAKYATYNIADDFSKVDLELNTVKETITQSLTAMGYKCK